MPRQPGQSYASKNLFRMLFVVAKIAAFIQHLRYLREYHIGKYLLDGFNAETDTVWEI